MKIYKAEYRKQITPIDGNMIPSDAPEWTSKLFADLDDAANWLRGLGKMECYRPEELDKSSFGGGIYTVDFFGERVIRDNALALLVDGEAEKYYEQYFGRLSMLDLN